MTQINLKNHLKHQNSEADGCFIAPVRQLIQKELHDD